VSSIESSVDRMIDTYKSAALARDAPALMRLYDPAVRVFDAWGLWCHEGAAAWQTAVEGWFTSLGTDRVRVRFDEVHVAGGPELASLNAIVTYAAESDQGEARQQMQNRLTWVMRTSGHVLRIVHEHTSAPIGFEDMKAILQRTPAR
jgi:ketosteroid isomerase-like protein